MVYVWFSIQTQKSFIASFFNWREQCTGIIKYYISMVIRKLVGIEFFKLLTCLVILNNYLLLSKFYNQCKNENERFSIISNLIYFHVISYIWFCAKVPGTIQFYICLLQMYMLV